MARGIGVEEPLLPVPQVAQPALSRFLFRTMRESRFSMRLASASSQRRQVGIQASTASRHRGLERSSVTRTVDPAFFVFSRSSSRNLMRCFVTSSTLRRTECQEYGWPCSRVNSAVTLIHHSQSLLRWPNVSAWRLQIWNSDTSSLVVNRLPCFRDLPNSSPSSSPPCDTVFVLPVFAMALDPSPEFDITVSTSGV